MLLLLPPLHGTTKMMLPEVLAAAAVPSQVNQSPPSQVNQSPPSQVNQSLPSQVNQFPQCGSHS
jgi:hypothetical protein